MFPSLELDKKITYLVASSKNHEFLEIVKLELVFIDQFL